MNSTYKLAPWADALYAMDALWWTETQPVFSGAKITASFRAGKLAQKTAARPAGNSGAGAMLYAKHCGATKLVLLGFDAKPADDGRKHWHADHKKPLGNAGHIADWPEQFKKIAPLLHGVEVVNCTRDTAITCWAQQKLEAVLC